MVVFSLQSLVLRGVSVVLGDGQAVELRRGAGYEGGSTTPEIAISMRFQPPSWLEGNPPATRPDHDVDDDLVAEAATGAGRPLGLAGVLCRRGAAPSAARGGHPAAPAFGGVHQPITVQRGRTTALRTTFGGESTSGRPSTASARALPLAGFTGGVWAAKRSSAPRTPPASTWGKGGR